MFMGPNWGSGSLPWLNTLFTLPLVLLVISTLMFLCSFNKMKPTEENQSEDISNQRREVFDQSNIETNVTA